MLLFIAYPIPRRTKLGIRRAELSARITDQLFQHLDAPVRRVAATDTFVAYQPLLENAILPQVADLYRAMKELAGY